MHFLDSQKGLTKVISPFTSVYLQSGEIVDVEESERREFAIGYTDQLDEKIKAGLVQSLYEESEIQFLSTTKSLISLVDFGVPKILLRIF